jgi:hypothetical protein
MAYYIDLFSPETREAFACSPRDVFGFRLRHKGIAERVKPGDLFICYLTRLSRWFGVLEVVEGPYIDNKPIFFPEDDPFVVRFRVRTLILLDHEKAIPIHHSEIWKGLSFTRNLDPRSLGWTAKVRGSLVRLDDADGQFLFDRLKAQLEGGIRYPLEEEDRRKLKTHTVTRPDKIVTVTVPDDSISIEISEQPIETEARESIRIQALIADIGASMGLSIWVPRADRGAVLREWNRSRMFFLSDYP